MAQRELVQATATTLKVLTIIQKKPYQQFTPQAWHKQFVGKAKCTKDEVKSCILSDNTISCKIKNDLPYDTYDAIAIGVTAARKNEWIEIEWV
jgi:Holliday junction resolvasome RuvABC endonuclease subunit